MFMARFRLCGVVIALALLGCGRTGLEGNDGGFVDDGPQPCVPDCAKICDLQKDCGLIAAGRISECISACTARPSDPTVLCLAQLVCRAGVQDCTAANTCLTNPNVPDLLLKIYPSSTSPGELRYRATVCNQGTGSSPASAVHFYRDRSAPPLVGQQGDQIVALPSLAVGACSDFYATDTGLPAGSYSVWGQVDADNTVVELDENNNIDGPKSVPVGGAQNQPDLVIVSLTWSNTGSTSGYYTAKVCNNGQASSSSASLGVYYNRSSAPGASTPPSKTAAVGFLSPGACTAHTVTASLGQGTFTSWAFIDAGNAVAESNESNNVYGPIKITLGGPPKPDLVVKNLMAYPPGSSGDTTYVAEVCNVGGGSAPFSYLDLYPNRSSAPTPSSPPSSSIYIKALSPGGCTSVKVSLPLAPGAYLSWVYIDRSNVVPESNEGNNVFGPVKFSVGGSQADLVVTGLQVTVTPLGYVYYYATVCNYGSGAAGSTQIDLYTNRSSAPPASLAGDQVTSVFPLGPGACNTRYFNISLPAGTYQSWVRVDRKDVVAESNEGNNVYGPVKVTVGSTGQPDLVLQGLTASPSPTGSTYYVATICNNGKAQSGFTQVDLYTNRTTAPPAALPGETYTSVPPLGPGVCTTRYLYANLQPGSYQSWARVDRTNVVAESDESNNVYGPLKVTVGSSLPDLTISSFNATAAPTGATTYTVGICNNGTASAAPTYIDLYTNSATPPPAGQVGDSSTYLSGLAAGVCTIRTISVNLQAGTYSSWVRVDRSNYVTESNEGNNLQGPLKVTVSGGGLPDLTVGSFNVYASSYSPTATFSGSVCNAGAAAAPASTLYIYYNVAGPPKPTDKADKSLAIGALAQGACQSFYTSSAMVPGTYQSWAFIDAVNAVQESNESNNIAGPRYFGINANGYCTDICATLISPCNMINNTQLQWCINTCLGQPGSKIMCAYQAAMAKQCSQILGCYTGP